MVESTDESLQNLSITDDGSLSRWLSNRMDPPHLGQLGTSKPPRHDKKVLWGNQWFWTVALVKINQWRVFSPSGGTIRGTFVPAKFDEAYFDTLNAAADAARVWRLSNDPGMLVAISSLSLLVGAWRHRRCH